MEGHLEAAGSPGLGQNVGKDAPVEGETECYLVFLPYSRLPGVAGLVFNTLKLRASDNGSNDSMPYWLCEGRTLSCQ